MIWLVRAVVILMILLALGNLVGAAVGGANMRHVHWNNFLMWASLATIVGLLALLL